MAGMTAMWASTAQGIITSAREVSLTGGRARFVVAGASDKSLAPWAELNVFQYVHDAVTAKGNQTGGGRGGNHSGITHLASSSADSGGSACMLQSIWHEGYQPTDERMSPCLWFHVQHLREVWSYHVQGPRDEAPLIIAAVIPEVSKLRTAAISDVPAPASCNCLI